MSIIQSDVVMMLNNLLTQNGNSNLNHGGAILLINSDVSIVNNTFRNNMAVHGAAIAFICSSMDK